MIFYFKFFVFVYVCVSSFGFLDCEFEWYFDDDAVKSLILPGPLALRVQEIYPLVFQKHLSLKQKY